MHCVTTSFNHPGWPSVLSSTDLSTLAGEQPLDQQWWVPECESDENEDGTSDVILTFSLYSLTIQ
jgi:hypothetical protein